MMHESIVEIRCRFASGGSRRWQAVSYAAIKLLAGRPRECPTAVYLVAVVFALKFALL